MPLQLKGTAELSFMGTDDSGLGWRKIVLTSVSAIDPMTSEAVNRALAE